MQFLVIRVGRAGDIVMTTPALAALLEYYPEATITMLTSPDGKRLLQNYNSRLNEIWVWDRSRLGAFLAKKKFRDMIVPHNFDKIFCFDTSDSIASVYSGASSEIWQQPSLGENIHCARHYLNLIEKSCSERIDDISVNLTVDMDASKRLDIELEAAGVTPGDIVIMLHPTFSGYSRFGIRKRKAQKHKLWPPAYFGRLGEQLSKLKLRNAKSPKLIIDLLQNEANIGQKIVEYSHGHITLFCSAPNIERYKALLKRADLIVTPDTGPMHIAAAVGTRIVALFSGKDPSDCGPYTEQDRFTVLRAESTPHPEVGISAISVNEAVNASIKQLNHKL